QPTAWPAVIMPPAWFLQKATPGQTQPMVDPTPSDYNLTYLRERWERDKSSRIFLQLAEEYRRRGLHAEALEVLETGLGFHPGYLAAQVALGRCRLEAGQPEAAVKVLEKVLTQ